MAYEPRRSFCGGAGFAMSASLVRVAACVAPICAKFKSLGEIPYDRRMGVCFSDLLGVEVDSRRDVKRHAHQSMQSERLL